MLDKKSKSGIFVLMILIIISCVSCMSQADQAPNQTGESTSYKNGATPHMKKARHNQQMHRKRKHAGEKSRSNANVFPERHVKKLKKQHTTKTGHIGQKKVADEQKVKNNTITEKAKKDDVKGIYLNKTAMKEENIQTYIDLVKETNLNTVVMDVKDDFGKLTYDSNIDAVNEIDADKERTVEDMKKLLRRLQDNGIYTIARLVVFKDPYLATQKSELSIRKKDGSIWKDSSGVQWIDPYKQEIWKYVTDIAKEVATLGFDEIQYDYIRFPENAKEIDEIVTYDNQDNRSKAENIAAFLRFSNGVLRNHSVRTSADVFGLVTSANDDMGIGQKWEMVSPYVDFISPMTYPSHYGPGIYGLKEPNDHPYKLVKHAMKDAIKRNQKLDKRAIIRPWVQDFNLKRTYTSEDIKGQIQAMNEQGITQYLVWNAASEYKKAAYQ